MLDNASPHVFLDLFAMLVREKGICKPKKQRAFVFFPFYQLLPKLVQVIYSHSLFQDYYLWPDRVLNAHHTDASEAGENVAFVVPVRFSVGSGEVAIGYADGPQTLGGHGLDHLPDHVISVSWPEHPCLPRGSQDLITPGAKERGHGKER